MLFACAYFYVVYLALTFLLHSNRVGNGPAQPIWASRGGAKLGSDGPSPGNMPNTFLNEQVPIKSVITNLHYSTSQLHSNRVGNEPVLPT